MEIVSGFRFSFKRKSLTVLGFRNSFFKPFAVDFILPSSPTLNLNKALLVPPLPSGIPILAPEARPPAAAPKGINAFLAKKSIGWIPKPNKPSLLNLSVSTSPKAAVPPSAANAAAVVAAGNKADLKILFLLALGVSCPILFLEAKYPPTAPVPAVANSAGSAQSLAILLIDSLKSFEPNVFSKMLALY